MAETPAHPETTMGWYPKEGFLFSGDGEWMVSPKGDGNVMLYRRHSSRAPQYEGTFDGMKQAERYIEVGA